VIFITFSLKLHKNLALAIFAATMLYRTPELLLAYTAVGIHELCHAIACVKLNYMPGGLYIGICGMHLNIPDLKYFTDKILIYSAGPLASLFTYILTKSALIIFPVKSYYLSFFAFANLSAAVINIIPIAPLDGASILRALLAKYFGIIKGNRILKKISSFFYVFFSAVNICFILLGIFNPGLFLFFIFSAKHKNDFLYSKDEKNVLSGIMGKSKKIKLVSCDSHSELLSLASLISYDYTLLFAVFCNDRFIKELSQSDIIHGINTYGALCTAVEYIEHEYGI